MATSGSFNTGSVGNFYFTIAWKRTGYDSSKNEHYINVTVTAHNTPGYYRTVYAKKLTANGTTIFEEAGTSGNGKSYYDGNQVTSKDITVKSSNSAGDGSLNLSFEAGVGQYPSTNCSGSKKYDLDRIPRYLTSIKLENTAQSYNSLSFKWTCSPERDWTQYRIKKNGGSYGAWTDAGDTGTTSGTFSIGGLSESTSYVVQVRLRRKDSQLWSESNEVTKSTVSGHTSITQFEVNKVTGKSDQLKITWAAGNACDHGWYSIDNGKTWIDGLSYPDQIISGLSGGTSYSVKIKVRRKDSQMITESGTVTQTTYTQTKFTKNNVNHISGYNGLSQLKVEWETNITIQKLELSLNDGSTWTDKGNPNSTSGNFTITSLSMDTYYNIKLRATSKDGSVVVATGTIKQNTYNKVTGNLYKNGTKLNVTTGIQITTTDELEFKDISNPAGCTYKIYFETPDNTRRITQSSTKLTAEQIQSMFQYLPNSNSQAFNVGIATMNGNTEAQYVDFYGNLVITNSNPTFNNFTYEDTDTTCKVLTGGNQGIIKGYSDVKINISAAHKAIGKDYATISKYRVVIGEKQKEIAYSSSSNVSGQIDNVVNNVFTVYAIDSRGNSTAKQISPSAFYDYSNIKITKAEIARTNGVGKETELYFEGQYWNHSFGNITNGIVECYYQYKTTSSNQWVRGTTTLNLTFEAGRFIFRGLVKGDEGAQGFSVTNNFNIKIFIKDRLSQDTFDLILGSGTPQLAVAQKGVAVNGMFDEDDDGALQVCGLLKSNDGKRYIMQYLEKIGVDDDFDNLIIPGIFSVGSASSISNAPYTGSIYGYLEVIVNTMKEWNPSDNGSWIWQKFFSTNGHCYCRNAVNNTTWSAWTQIY